MKSATRPGTGTPPTAGRSAAFVAALCWIAVLLDGFDLVVLGAIMPALTDPDSPRRTEVTDRVLACIDVLVDGPFVEELKDISARFRGSSNQRIIDLVATREAGEVVEWRGDEDFATRGSW